MVGALRDYVADVQKRLDEVQKSVGNLDVQPQALRDQASKAVSTRVETLNKDAQARRRLIEKRVADLQSEVQTFPTRLQKLLDDPSMDGKGLAIAMADSFRDAGINKYKDWEVCTISVLDLTAYDQMEAAVVGLADAIAADIDSHKEAVGVAGSNARRFKAEFEYHVMRLMSEIMAHTITLHLLDAPGRVHRFMRKHPELAERIPKNQLATYLNLTPETLSRLKQKGKI